MDFERIASAAAETADQAKPLHPLADRLSELLANPTAATFGDLARVVEAISGELSFAPAIAAREPGPSGAPAHDVQHDDSTPAADQVAAGI